MRPLDVGRDIDYRCTRCKMVLAHTILAMVGGVPARVKCNTCHTDRKYRSSGGSRSATPRRAAPKKPVAVRAKETRQASAFEKERAWETQFVAAKERGEKHLEYSMRERFEKGNVVIHGKFGLGVVAEFADGNKIRVTFRDGDRLLIHGRPMR